MSTLGIFGGFTDSESFFTADREFGPLFGGAIGGMAAGLAGVVLWQVATSPGGPLAAYSAVDPVVPGFLASAVATVGLSLLTRETSPPTDALS